jgi:glutaconate CoA-transferase subunit A
MIAGGRGGGARSGRRAPDLRALVAAVPDGALLTFSGFQLNRAPMAMVHELVRQGRRALRVVGPPNPLPLDLLAAAGVLAEAEFGFLGFQYEGGFVVAPHVRRAIEAGRLAWRERDVYEIVQGLRAAALGLPFLPAPGPEFSDYPRANGSRLLAGPEGRAPVIAALPIRPDFALVHAQEVDTAGNLALGDPFAEDLQAAAAVRVLATAERIVERIDRPTIPGDRVERFAVVPGGAFPASCHGHYPYSAAHLRLYLEAAEANTIDRYLGRFVRDCVDHTAFLRAAGGPGEWTTAPPTGAPARPAGPGGTAGAEGPSGTERADRIVVNVARAITDGDTVVTGVASALPMLAVALARATRVERLTYINCVGAINPPLDRAWPTSVDVRLLEGCEARLSLPDLFDRARRQPVDVMAFGAAQVDREGCANVTCIGDYARPRVKLPGPAGSASMRPFVRRVVLIVPRHTPRTMVPRVDFVTSAPSPLNEQTLVVTDIAVLHLVDGRLRLRSIHAGIPFDRVREQTGFPVEWDGTVTPDPTPEERRALAHLDPAAIRLGMV